MPTFELLEERLISGRGILKVPANSEGDRLRILVTDLVRPPLSLYSNKSYNPNRSRYGTLVFLRRGYVINTEPVEYPRMSFDGIQDITGQTLLAVKCAYDGILDTFVNLSVALAGTPGGIGLFPITKDNNIKDYTSLNLAWDEVRLVCYSTTALQLRLFSAAYDACDNAFIKDLTIADFPSPIAEVSPSTALDNISTPYSGGSDGGNTVPIPADSNNRPGCWKLEYRYISGFIFPPNVLYVVGTRTEVPILVIEGSIWLIRANGTGRIMYPNFVNTTSTPEFTSSTYERACSVSNPFDNG